MFYQLAIAARLDRPDGTASIRSLRARPMVGGAYRMPPICPVP
jgi:hypothetical protein